LGAKLPDWIAVMFVVMTAPLILCCLAVEAETSPQHHRLPIQADLQIHSRGER
jgi:hypothetical protein